MEIRNLALPPGMAQVFMENPPQAVNLMICGPSLTAAHRTLPFGTWVQVTKVGTGKTVIVRINDRGPFIRGRTIDLSYAAARELAMIGEGTADVALTIVSPHNAMIPAIGAPTRFWVQAGAFTALMEAMTLRGRFASQ